MVVASALITKEKIELKYKLQHFHKSLFSKKKRRIKDILKCFQVCLSSWTDIIQIFALLINSGSLCIKKTACIYLPFYLKKEPQEVLYKMSCC